MSKGKLRKGLSFFLSFLMVLSLCAVSVPEEVKAEGNVIFTVTADKKELKRGDEVTLTVTMSGNTDAYGVQFELLHDDMKLQLESVNALPATGSVKEGSMLSSTHETVDHTALTVAVSTDQAIKNGLVLSAKYKVLDTAAGGKVSWDSAIQMTEEYGDMMTNYSVSDETNMKVVVPVDGIKINKTSMTLAKGQTEKLTASLIPADASADIQWTSSDSKIAAVSNDGTVTAVGTGKATVTAAVNGISASCEVTVNNPLKDLKIVSAEGVTTLKKSQTTQLTAKLDPEDTTDDKTVTWSSSNESVATVNSKGLVTAVSDGTVTISAKVGDETASYNLTVKEIRLTGISLDTTETTLHKGKNQQLNVSYTPENTTDSKTVTWTSSDPSTVSVDGNGKITAKQVGGAVITAKVGNFEAKCTVTVDAPLISIVTEKDALSLIKNQTAKIAYKLNPEDTTDDKNVTFTSSDESVATVSEDGTVTAVKTGTTNVTLTGANDVTATVVINVTEIPVDQIVLDKQSTVIEKGQTDILTATVGPENTTDEDTSVTWKSSNPDVVTVSPNKTNNGESVTVTATDKGGKATITATTANGKTATCEITVPVHIEKIEITGTKELLRNQTAVEMVKYFPTADITDQLGVTWKSDNEAVATVDEKTGTITAIKEGTANITATTIYTAAPISDTIKITVKENHMNDELGKKIDFAEVKDALLIGQQMSLNKYLNLEKIVGENEITDDFNLEWSVEDEGIASVDQSGVLTGVKAGKTIVRVTVTATSAVGEKVGTYTAETEVNIKEVPLESIAFDKVIKEMVVGGKDKLGIIYNPENTTDVKDVQWSSSNQDILSVENGNLIAKKAGEAEIKAKVGEKEISCKIVVKENTSGKDQKTDNSKLNIKKNTNNSNNTKKNGTTTKSGIKTGDTANIALYSALLLLAAAAVVLILRKRISTK